MSEFKKPSHNRTGRKRSRYVGFCMTEEEWLALDKKVTEMGIPKGTYLRNLASRILLKPVPDEKLIEILKQMRHIGNNINQLTIVANKTGSIDMVLLKDYYERQLQEIAEVKSLLRQPIILPEDICP
ncbi:MAG: plasmid mobilization relaxosome protein MobC [Solobacterium sp.]|nr:plasmid mobilization relaxosome protein MobC [Solobacterium sp.]